MKFMNSLSFWFRLITFLALSILGILTIIGSGDGGGGGGPGATTYLRYALVANQDDDSVSTYVVDDTTGRLKWIGKVDAGTEPISVAIHPTGRYAYVVNSGSANVSQYTIGADGGLAPIASAIVVTGSSPTDVTVDPSGRYAYVVNWNSSYVSQYTIGTNGRLTPMASATVAAETTPLSIAIAGTWR